MIEHPVVLIRPEEISAEIELPAYAGRTEKEIAYLLSRKQDGKFRNLVFCPEDIERACVAKETAGGDDQGTAGNRSTGDHDHSRVPGKLALSAV